MGTVLSVFRPTTGAPIGTTRESSGGDATGSDVSQTGATKGETAADTAAAATTPATEQQPQQQQKEYIDQCGLEDDSDEWEDCDPEPRWKECRLAQRYVKEFHENVEKCFSHDALIGKRVRFHPNIIIGLLNEVKLYLRSEPMLIDDVPFGVTIVGDLHGQLHDLHRVFTADSKDGKPGWLCTKYLFLGDYVDRGRQSIEILVALFSLKCLYPDRIFLLRGNHEFGAVNWRYGFTTECGDRYKEKVAELLYYMFNEVFGYLSVAAIVGDKYFCAHGGVSTSGFTRRQLKRLPKPLNHSNEDVLVHDIVWSDPAKGLRGTSFNVDRGSSIYYGLDSLAHALASMQTIALFRAHTVLDKGYEIVGNMCVSLFTATGPKNDGAVAVIADDGKLLMRILKTDLERVKWEQRLKKIDRDGRIDVVTEKDNEKEDITTFDEDGGTGKLKDF